MLLVSDREDAQNLPRVIGQERLFVCSLNEATGTEDQIIVIDVDLDDRQKRRHLKHLFHDVRPLRSLAIAVDSSSLTHRHAAQRLGATTLLSQPVTSAILYRFIHGLEPKHNPAPIENAMTQGAITLAEAFNKVRRGQRLDLKAIRLASSDVADAAAQYGIQAWLSSVAATCEGSFRHSLITAGLASAFARQIGMGTNDIALLTTTALLLDIGTAALPRSLVDKTLPTTAEEEQLLHRHAADAADYLERCSDLPEVVIDTVRHHHELLDGSGYPDGIGADRISDLTRVLTVCDLFADLIDERHHHPALTPADALDVLNVMARENKIAVGHLAVFEAVFAGRIGWPHEGDAGAAEAS